MTIAPSIDIADRRLGSWRIRISRDGFRTADLAAGYDRAAPRWDRILSRIGSARAYQSITAQAFAGVPATAPVSVLDVGTGTGALTLAAARSRPSGIDATACDVSAAMRDKARRAFAKAGLAARVLDADLGRLPFADGAFDLTMAAHVVEHLPDPAQAVAELARVTRPGGRVLVCLTRPGWVGRFIQFQWRTRLIAPLQMREALARAGLTGARRVPVPGHPRFNAFSYAVLADRP